MLATTRSSNAGSASTGGTVSGTDTSIRGSCPQASDAMALATTSSRNTGRLTTSTAPACSRLMSSRFPTRASRRSDSASMVARNSARSLSLQATSSCNRLVAEALIDASGVRRSWETAWRSAARSGIGVGQRGGRGHLGLQPPALEGQLQLGHERPQHSLVVVVQLSTTDDEQRLRTDPEVPRDVVERRGGHVLATAGQHLPGVVGSVEQRHGIQGERGADLLHQLEHRVLLAQERGGRAGQHLCLRPGATSLA